MAKRTHRKRDDRSYYNTGRETYRFANPKLPLDQNNYFKRSIPLNEFEDRRHFHPEGTRRPATTFRSLPAKLKVRDIPRQKANTYDYSAQSFTYPSYALGFIQPKRVLLCVRRNIRKQVLHAFGIAGRRGLGRDGVKWNEDSKISCK